MPGFNADLYQKYHKIWPTGFAKVAVQSVQAVLLPLSNNLNIARIIICSPRIYGGCGFLLDRKITNAHGRSLFFYAFSPGSYGTLKLWGRFKFCRISSFCFSWKITVIVKSTQELYEFKKLPISPITFPEVTHIHNILYIW